MFRFWIASRFEGLKAKKIPRKFRFLVEFREKIILIIILKVLQKASYTHPYVDSYYNRRDHSLMLVLSNPHDESCLSNHEEWTIKLHSNVGFRYAHKRPSRSFRKKTKPRFFAYQYSLFVEITWRRFMIWSANGRVTKRPNTRHVS